MSEINENKEECALCGGYCCKKSGCDFTIDDFESLKLKYLKEKLDEGYISIVAHLRDKVLKNGQIIIEPFLYLRVRNTNKPVIDLVSINTACSLLKEDGCPFDYEHRPSGGKNLVPGKGNRYVNGKMLEGSVLCTPRIDQYELLKPWWNYQGVLSKLVKMYTGKNVYDKLKEDMENLFYDLLMNNVENAMTSEVMEICCALPTLIKIYPLEYKRALIRKDKNKIRILTK